MTSPLLSSVDTGQVTVSGNKWGKGEILQTERLLTARARYGQIKSIEGDTGNLGGDRGNWSYIKLVTSDAQYKEYLSGNPSRKPKFSDLTGRGSIVAGMANPQTNAGYDKFLLTGVSANFSEKIQITEVFGDNEIAYYFGHQPMMFSVSGILIDSPDNSWFTDWLKMYSEFLRGSQLAKNHELLKIVLPNMTLVGTMVGFSYSQNAERDVDIPFSFQFLAKVITPTPVTGQGMLFSNKLDQVNFSNVAAFTSQSSINNIKNQVQNASLVIQNPNSTLADKAAALNVLGTTTGGAYSEFLENSKGTLTGYQNTIDGWAKSSSSYFEGLRSSSLFQSVTTSLAGIRTNLFSPVYGILSSLSKLVSGSAAAVTSLVGALITPVRNILRDITNISNQAVALVNLVNSSISGVIRYTRGQLGGLATDFDAALDALGKAAGAIATAPLTAAQSVRAALQAGSLSVSAPAFLASSGKLSYVRPSLAVRFGSPPPTKIQLVLGIPTYSSSSGVF